MKNLFDKHKWLFLLLGLALMVLGGLGLWFVLTKNDNSLITRAICLVVAVYLFLFALTLTIAGIITINKTKTASAASAFISAGVATGVGISLCFKEVAGFLEGIVGYIIPYSLLVVGALILLMVLVLLLVEDTRHNIKVWVMYLIFGVVDLTIGIILVLNRVDTLKWVYGSISVIIILTGLVYFVYGLAFGFRKNKENEIVVQDAEIEPKHSK